MAVTVYMGSDTGHSSNTDTTTVSYQSHANSHTGTNITYNKIAILLCPEIYLECRRTKVYNEAGLSRYHWETGTPYTTQLGQWGAVHIMINVYQVLSYNGWLRHTWLPKFLFFIQYWWNDKLFVTFTLPVSMNDECSVWVRGHTSPHVVPIAEEFSHRGRAEVTQDEAHPYLTGRSPCKMRGWHIWPMRLSVLCDHGKWDYMYLYCL